MRFHHTGMACKDIDRERNWFLQLGYVAESAPFVDPLQGIRGQFLVCGDSRLELLEALPDSDVLRPWLAHGSPLYHLGFEVTDLHETLRKVIGTGAKLASEPKPAVAFGGRRVAFCIRANRMLVELIEAQLEARP